MSGKSRRLVAVCQQVLAIGTVIALAAPATGVVTLHIGGPERDGTDAPPGTGVAGGSLVASRPVTPHVREFGFRGVDPRGLAALDRGARPSRSGDLRLAAAETADGNGKLAALSAPEPANGYATVGVTWTPGKRWAERAISFSVRSKDNGRWSGWQKISYDPQEGPDPDSREGRLARPGTDPIVVGAVDKVQVKAVTPSGAAPDGMRLAVVDPGRTVAAKVEQPAIDTAKLASARLVSADTSGTPDRAAALAAANVTPKPRIFSRAQWGANEAMRDKPSLHYGEVHAGFVHHTVNANGYSRAQVPSILRGIYAYHTQSKGWSDIGYNFLVDRFGRIWEGRFGGVDRPVVGAHTLGYNDYSFAMSAIGNYQTGRPSAAMVDAYGRLFAWKLSLHGVDAASTRQWVGKRFLPAINGHRDVGQTACPGRFLYAKIPTIRRLAAGYQHPFAGRNKNTNVSGTRWPDLVVRDATTAEAYVIRTGGQVRFGPGVPMATGWGGMDLMTASRDLTGDHIPDMVARNASTKSTSVYPGNGKGGFRAPVTHTMRFSTRDQLSAVGDMTGDRKNDLVARDVATKRLVLYPGRRAGTFARVRLLSADWSRFNLTVGAGDLNGDGHKDLLARDASGILWLVPGLGRATLGKPVALPGRWGGYDLVAGLGDVTNDGRADIVVRDRSSKLTYIYPGDGHGGLRARYGPFSRFGGVDFLAVAGQVTGGKSTDLVGRDAQGRLLAFPNSGRRNIGSIVDTGTRFPGADLVLNVGDWNGDGHGDVMTRASGGDMFLYRGDGRSHFATPVRAGTGFGGVRLLAAVGDMTGDGLPDLMGQPKGGGMRIYPSNGDTGFRRSYVAHSAISANRQVGIGRWDSDGSPDSIVRRDDGSLVVFAGNGPGGLTTHRKIGTGFGSYVWLQGSGDANGDGRPDIIARDRAGTLWLLPGQRDGFGPRRFISDGFEKYDLGR